MIKKPENPNMDNVTLRDWLAGCALQGMYAADNNESIMSIERKTREAYQVADAMLAERAKS